MADISPLTLNITLQPSMHKHSQGLQLEFNGSAEAKFALIQNVLQRGLYPNKEDMPWWAIRKEDGAIEVYSTKEKAKTLLKRMQAEGLASHEQAAAWYKQCVRETKRGQQIADSVIGATALDMALMAYEHHTGNPQTYLRPEPKLHLKRTRYEEGELAGKYIREQEEREMMRGMRAEVYQALLALGKQSHGIKELDNKLHDIKHSMELAALAFRPGRHDYSPQTLQAACDQYEAMAKGLRAYWDEAMKSEKLETYWSGEKMSIRSFAVMAERELAPSGGGQPGRYAAGR